MSSRAPTVGELLPRAAEAFGVRYKLETYTLDITHKDGGPKARGFLVILGITLRDIDYLEAEIMAGILDAQTITSPPTIAFNPPTPRSARPLRL